MEAKIETATETETTIVTAVVVTTAEKAEASRENTWVIVDLLAVANVNSTEEMIAKATTIHMVDLVVEIAVAETSKTIVEVEATAATVTTTTLIAILEEVIEEAAVAKVDLPVLMVKIVHSVAARTTTRAVEVEVMIALSLEIKMSLLPSASNLLARTWILLTSRVASSTTETQLMSD